MNYALSHAVLTCTAPSMFLVIRFLCSLCVIGMAGPSVLCTCSSVLLALLLVSSCSFHLRKTVHWQLSCCVPCYVRYSIYPTLCVALHHIIVYTFAVFNHLKTTISLIV